MIGRLLAPLAALCVLLAPAMSEAQTRWRIQNLYASGNQVADEIEKWAASVKTMSGGRLELQILPAGAAVGAAGTLEAVKAGVLDGHLSYPVLWSGIEPAFSPLGDLPGGYDSFYQLSEFYYRHGGLELLRELYGRHNLFTVGVATGGPESMPSRVPIRTVEDFKGLKIRVPSGMTGTVFEKLGAAPVNLPFSEVFSALERGVVDAADAGSLSYNDQIGVHAAAKNVFYRSPHSFGVLDFSVNRDKWNALPADIKEMLQVSVRDLMLNVVARVNADDLAIVSRAQEKGLTIVEFTPEQRTKFRRVALDVWQDWAKRSPAAKKVIDAQIAYLKLIGSL